MNFEYLLTLLIVCVTQWHFLLSLTGPAAPTTVVTMIVLVVTIIVCLSHVCFGHFKYLSAHNYKVQLHLLTRAQHRRVYRCLSVDSLLTVRPGGGGRYFLAR